MRRDPRNDWKRIPAKRRDAVLAIIGRAYGEAIYADSMLACDLGDALRALREMHKRRSQWDAKKKGGTR